MKGELEEDILLDAIYALNKDPDKILARIRSRLKKNDYKKIIELFSKTSEWLALLVKTDINQK